MHQLMGEDVARLPETIKGLMLSCILSDTLEFRSPTTTDTDRVGRLEDVVDLAGDAGTGVQLELELDRARVGERVRQLPQMELS